MFPLRLPVAGAFSVAPFFGEGHSPVQTASADDYSMWSNDHTHDQGTVSFTMSAGDDSPRAWGTHTPPLHLHYVTFGSKEIAEKYLSCKEQNLRTVGDLEFSILHQQIPQLNFSPEKFEASVVLVEYDEIQFIVSSLECVPRDP